MPDTTVTETEPVETTWASITVTILFTLIECVVFIAFFLVQRKKDMKANKYELFEPRQFTRAHRSPPPFDGGTGVFAWARAAYQVTDEECLASVGLDTFMFLRFLRLAARMAFLGSILSFILIPVYATGEAIGLDTESFNKLTLARVGSNSSRLWATLLCEFVFIAFILRSFWMEWELYAKHRYTFLSYGDVDTPGEFRYACIVENVPRHLRSVSTLRSYFEKLFPHQVQQVSVCLITIKLDNLVNERHTKIIQLEKAVAFTHAKPLKPLPTMKSTKGYCGKKVESIPFLTNEIDRLNKEIDAERHSLYSFANTNEQVKVEQAVEIEDEHVKPLESFDASSPVEIGLSETGGIIVGDTNLSIIKYKNNEEVICEESDEEGIEADGQPSSTAFVTFTSLRSKQAAIQVEISGKKDKVDIFPAPEPSSVIWPNVTTNLSKLRVSQMIASCLWITGVLFWAVPVSFVVSIANLNGILQSFGLGQADPSSFWYGLISGLLPVIALQVLMIVLYMSIVSCAKSFVRLKSMPEVDAYAFYWHQLFQFSNLWLILIGGSAFNQIDSLISGSSSISGVIATALPASSVFFVNMILLGSFGAFGLQLSLLPTYGVTLIMKMIQPEAQRTQRMIDASKKPPSLVWGKQIPGMVFVFLVAVLYFPIVPIMEVFALVYFCGHYLVFKHQCLHVYAQEFEGGGLTTWQRLFSFLMASIYMSELAFIIYVGLLKKGWIQGFLGFIPFIATILVHNLINRNIRQPLEHLSLEAAADFDIKEGVGSVDNEAIGNMDDAMQEQVYGQPVLRKSLAEREPLPYRRDQVDMIERIS